MAIFYSSSFGFSSSGFSSRNIGSSLPYSTGSVWISFVAAYCSSVLSALLKSWATFLISSGMFSSAIISSSTESSVSASCSVGSVVGCGVTSGVIGVSRFSSVGASGCGVFNCSGWFYYVR